MFTNYRLGFMKTLFDCSYLIKHRFLIGRRYIFWFLPHKILGTVLFFRAHTGRNPFIVTVSVFLESRLRCL